MRLYSSAALGPVDRNWNYRCNPFRLNVYPLPKHVLPCLSFEGKAGMSTNFIRSKLGNFIKSAQCRRRKNAAKDKVNVRGAMSEG